jgi:peptidoglycan/xylan/chitin deacetylase (PgdA/CDA1 family)
MSKRADRVIRPSSHRVIGGCWLFFQSPDGQMTRWPDLLLPFTIALMLGYVLGSIAAAAAASAAGYHTMAPRSQLYGRTWTCNRARPRQLALTFDDGPNDPHTRNLLEVLAKHDVHATFFMLGRHVRQLPQIAEAVARAGHVIGNHTYTHPNLIFTPRWQLTREIDDCEQVLTEVVGEHARLFRPPFGGRRPTTLHTIRAAGFTTVMWSVTAFDWEATSVGQIERNVARQVRGGDIILLHDGGHLSSSADRAFTVRAADRIIARYKQEGYDFVTVPELMKDATD